MLTATPINNSLNDLANQIQLGLKGELQSVPVPYTDPKDGSVKVVDFFDALNDIQKRSTNDPDFNWKSVENTLRPGIQKYLVRSTRQGVEHEASLKSASGEVKRFPKSKVEQVEYSYGERLEKLVSQAIYDKVELLEGIDATKIDLDKITDATQRSEHPFDSIGEYTAGRQSGVIQNIFQMLTLFGFTAYRPEVYQHKIYHQSPEAIKNLGLKEKEATTIGLQLSIHNMLLVTWIKRLESSTASLLASVRTYERRLEQFRDYLDKGYILSFSDIDAIERDYGDDLEKAFEDYDAYQIEAIDSNVELKKRGIEKRPADDTKYNIDAMYKDIAHDQLLARATCDVLEILQGYDNDNKLRAFAAHISRITSAARHGQKVLIFSFFTDTINYLRDELPKLVSLPNFTERSAFLSGGIGKIDNIVGRFSPVSKG